MSLSRRQTLGVTAAFRLLHGGPALAATANRTLANPNATSAARRLHTYLRQQYGRATLTGQQEQMVQTTRGAALAMYVVFDSPFMAVADSPDNHEGAAGIDFGRAVPCPPAGTRRASYRARSANGS